MRTGPVHCAPKLRHIFPPFRGNHDNPEVAWARGAFHATVCVCLFSSVPAMATGRRDSSPGRLSLALPSIWKKVRYRWSPHRINSVDLGASTGSLSEALVYPWIAHQHNPLPSDARPRSLSCQLPGPPLREYQLIWTCVVYLSFFFAGVIIRGFFSFCS